MIRSIIAVVAVGTALGALCATGGCSQTGIGDPCIPNQEYDTSFAGFLPTQVNTESGSFQCQTRLCLVNHFQGRVSCPYGQNPDGSAPQGANAACYVPGSTPSDPNRDKDKITPPDDPQNHLGVLAQCHQRTADKAVYCSCRCANLEGKTDDGGNYCTCPDGFTCSRLVTSTGPTDTFLVGSFCIKAGTDYTGPSQCNKNDVCFAKTVPPNAPPNTGECGSLDNNGR